MATQTLNEQAQEILKIAEQYGIEQNFFFITTFKRYQVQLIILNDLEKAMKEDGVLVTKEYIKGRKNVYSHPAVTEYNKTSTGANQTVLTLMKIITTLRENNKGDSNPLFDFIMGGSK